MVVATINFGPVTWTYFSQYIPLQSSLHFDTKSKEINYEEVMSTRPTDGPQTLHHGNNLVIDHTDFIAQ